MPSGTRVRCCAFRKDGDGDGSTEVTESSGFSLHAGVWAKGGEREKLEHLARYVSWPPIATQRLSLTDSGHVRYSLKTPYRDGTTHVIFEPEDFIARLAALVVIASIEEQPVIDRILEHLGVSPAPFDLIHASRGPPVGELAF